MSSPASAPAIGDHREVVADAGALDLTQPWELNPKVALRPEPFGALLYHFGTRKLSFLKNLTVVGIVQSLRDHASAEAALSAAGITAAQRPLYLQALEALAASGMIVRRVAASEQPQPQGVSR
ncbi:mycofactocin biosynthesis chaperone MftB [Gordonia sp. ABSL1-1]|uniref:mycofactocin biosynthesis chaperone MftB n=1 Tax=Gordonia sp. ABSL1-1 TaxID=3053923 RepID=UPI0025738A70|nr:mycofactocin biosynthesis chaperone MftB [Gordonia sp. ABSL1-1]MDL9937895.1 mycofactocin biosynthesis chaperone MftB [Gordonia sp. ABSL1-1]